MKYKAEDLVDWTDSHVNIQCSYPGCGKVDSAHNVDDFDAADIFFKEGWRSTGQNCYCPTHSKTLKQK